MKKLTKTQRFTKYICISIVQTWRSLSNDEKVVFASILALSGVIFWWFTLVGG